MASLSSRALVSLLALGLLSSACAGTQRKEKLVPEKTQKRSEERYGEQYNSMGSLNQTPAEQAAAAHEHQTRPVERPGNERGK